MCFADFGKVRALGGDLNPYTFGQKRGNPEVGRNLAGIRAKSLLFRPGGGSLACRRKWHFWVRVTYPAEKGGPYGGPLWGPGFILFRPGFRGQKRAPFWGPFGGGSRV